MQLPKVNFLDELQVLHHSRQCARAMIPHHPCPRPRGPRLLYLFVRGDDPSPPPLRRYLQIAFSTRPPPRFQPPACQNGMQIHACG